MYEEELRSLWLSVNKIAQPLADLSGQFLTLKGHERRFNHLRHTHSHLLTVSDALFEYLERRKNIPSPDPHDRLVVMMGTAAIENGKTVAQLANDELERLRASNA